MESDEINQMMGTVKKTILHPKHQKLNAKMAEFAGWEMPIQYQGIIHEHKSVRENVGIFDVSHMARIIIEGPDAEKLLDFLSTNKIAGKKEGSATYTVWCHEDGGCVDDLIVYRLGPEKFFVVVNASNREKDLKHLQKYAKNFQMSVTPLFDHHGILAVQGPKADQLFPLDMKPMRVRETEFEGQPLVVATTGYTGSGGFEIYAENSVIDRLWDYFTERGAEPIGLGARDTLRLEMGFALYGHELADDILPIETVSKWTVKLNKEDFVGKDALEKSESNRTEFGIILIDKGIAREGALVYYLGKQIGRVTSGTFSPSLQKGIAIVLGDQVEVDEVVEVEVRKRRLQGKVVKMPFI